jgi:hypothetical protein
VIQGFILIYGILTSSYYFTASQNGKTRQTDESLVLAKVLHITLKNSFYWLTVTGLRLISIRFLKVKVFSI